MMYKTVVILMLSLVTVCGYSLISIYVCDSDFSYFLTFILLSRNVYVLLQFHFISFAIVYFHSHWLFLFLSAASITSSISNLLLFFIDNIEQMTSKLHTTNGLV